MDAAMTPATKVRSEHWECPDCHVVWEFKIPRTSARLRKEGAFFFCWQCSRTTLHRFIRAGWLRR